MKHAFSYVDLRTLILDRLFSCKLCVAKLKELKIIFVRIMTNHISDVWTAVAQWLKCRATNRKVAGVIGIFH
jgi:hypothetical protein